MVCTLAPESVAVFAARAFAGILFFFQGYDAVFRIKMKGVIETMRLPLAEKGVPGFLIAAGSYFTCYASLVGGFMLAVGFAKYIVMDLLVADLLVSAITFSMIKAMWDMQFVFPRLVLLLFVLIVPSHWDTVTLDHCLQLEELTGF